MGLTFWVASLSVCVVPVGETESARRAVPAEDPIVSPKQPGFLLMLRQKNECGN